MTERCGSTIGSSGPYNRCALIGGHEGEHVHGASADELWELHYGNSPTSSHRYLYGISIASHRESPAGPPDSYRPWQFLQAVAGTAPGTAILVWRVDREAPFLEDGKKGKP